MKRKIKFKDQEKNVINIEISLENGKFSMVGDCGNSSGQMYDSIKPKNELQRELVRIWKTYHLNDMKAGTEKQENVLKNWKERPEGYSYDQDTEYLDSVDSSGKELTVSQKKKIDLKRKEINKKIEEIKDKIAKFDRLNQDYKTFKSGGEWVKSKELEINEFFHTKRQFDNFIKNKLTELKENKLILDEEHNKEKLKTLLYDEHPETKLLHKYGSGWLKRELPVNLEKDVNELCDKIEAVEKAEQEELKESNATWEDIDDPKVKALAQHLEISPQEAIDEISNSYDNTYTHGGIDYFVGTDEETNDECIEYLKSDTYIYQSYVEKQIEDGNAENVMNINDWADWVIEVDGYGHILNGWDGSEYTEEVDGETFYVIRR